MKHRAESYASIPVQCPVCGRTRWSRLPQTVIATAVAHWYSMRLDSPCHPVSWDASPLEMNLIRAAWALRRSSRHPP